MKKILAIMFQKPIKKYNLSLEIGFGSGENLLNLIDKSENSRNFIGCEPLSKWVSSHLLLT